MFANVQLPDLNAAAQAILPNRNWFDEIDSARQLQLLSEIAAHPGVVALADQPREVWLRLLFSFADAGHRGVAGARDIALVWCKTSPRFQSEAGFDRDWHSFKPRPVGITVATLARCGRECGLRPRAVAHGRTRINRHRLRHYGSARYRMPAHSNGRPALRDQRAPPDDVSHRGYSFG